MKRLVVCSDGTWQELSSEYPTNVVKIAQAITPTGSDGIPQIVFYDAGLGTRDLIVRPKEGAFGKGIDENIQDAYRFLCLNYEEGDEIYLFGFSRGAYTARSLGGLIAKIGLLPRKHIRKTPQAYIYYRVRKTDPDYETKKQEIVDFSEQYSLKNIAITVLGCWDTVGALGIPDKIPFLPLDQIFNRKYQFHDINLSPSIKNAFHAVAIDEIRANFIVTSMHRSAGDTQLLKEVWFPGDHGCIGGGRATTAGLSDRALEWMMDEIQKQGLQLTFNADNILDGFEPNHIVDFDNRPRGIFKLARTINRKVSEDFDALDVSVIYRWRDRIDYRPLGLSIHAAGLDRLKL